MLVTSHFFLVLHILTVLSEGSMVIPWSERKAAPYSPQQVKLLVSLQGGGIGVMVQFPKHFFVKKGKSELFATF